MKKRKLAKYLRENLKVIVYPDSPSGIRVDLELDGEVISSDSVDLGDMFQKSKTSAKIAKTLKSITKTDSASVLSAPCSGAV
jgi:hypothetical protein